MHLKWIFQQASNLHFQTVRNVSMLNGVTIAESKAQKDELLLQGNDIDMVSQSGAYPSHAIVDIIPIFPSSCIDPGHLPRTKQGYPQVLGRYLRFGEDHHRPGRVRAGLSVVDFFMSIMQSITQARMGCLFWQVQTLGSRAVSTVRGVHAKENGIMCH